MTMVIAGLLLFTHVTAITRSGPAKVHASDAKLSAPLRRALQGSEHPVAAWVFFADKGEQMGEKLRQVELRLNARNYRRRLRNRGSAHLVDEYDVPVVQDYVQRVRQRVVRLRHVSRWLNAVSVEADAAALRDIARWAFVKRLDLVRSSKAPVPQPDEKVHVVPSLSGSAETHTLNYGNSFTQNNQIDVPAMHDLGFDGSGVLIAMFDAGVNNLEHEAFSHLNILHTWDFVNNDANVDDDPAQLGNGTHGTWTLSAIAGFKEGQLIGPAYGADFLLAKTENTNFESHVEEDNWVAAAEWADSLGADIISSSLGYRDGFISGEADYTAANMDGKTTIVTIGAEIAASRGILVVNSAGNEGAALPGSNTLVAPSDGPNVLCVGAVDAQNTRVSFSSMGPTADGRIKPDVMAMGLSVRLASAEAPNLYTSKNGTSFSCPLAAGVAALLLQAVPALTNTQIMDILRTTASNANAPNNQIGWGIIDALAAYNLALVTDVEERQTPIASFVLHPAFPNPFNPSTSIRYELPDGQPSNIPVKLQVFNILGREVITLVDAIQGSGIYSVSWDGRDRRGVTVNTGVFIYRLQAGGQSKSGKVLFLK